MALIVGEWGTWHDVEPGTEPGFLYQQNALRDALVASVLLDIFNQHADRVRMANIAQTVNDLQAMILTPTYHVFDLYTVHHDAALLPMTLDRGTYTYDGESIPAVSATASRDDQGRIHVTMTNVDPHRSRTVEATIRGEQVSGVLGRLRGRARRRRDAHRRPAADIYRGAGATVRRRDHERATWAPAPLLPSRRSRMKARARSTASVALT